MYPDDNFQTCERLVSQAVEQGADLICFPECFAFMGLGSAYSLKFAQNLQVYQILLGLHVKLVLSIFQISSVCAHIYIYIYILGK